MRSVSIYSILFNDLGRRAMLPMVKSLAHDGAHELLLALHPPQVAGGIVAKAHIAHRLLAIEQLPAGLEVDVQIPPVVIVIHALFNVDLDRTDEIDHRPKAGYVRLHEAVNRDPEQLGYRLAHQRNAPVVCAAFSLSWPLRPGSAPGCRAGSRRGEALLLQVGRKQDHRIGPAAVCLIRRLFSSTPSQDENLLLVVERRLRERLDAPRGPAAIQASEHLVGTHAGEDARANRQEQEDGQRQPAPAPAPPARRDGGGPCRPHGLSGRYSSGRQIIPHTNVSSGYSPGQAPA